MISRGAWLLCAASCAAETMECRLERQQPLVSTVTWGATRSNSGRRPNGTSICGMRRPFFGLGPLRQSLADGIRQNRAATSRKPSAIVILMRDGSQKQAVSPGALEPGIFDVPPVAARMLFSFDAIDRQSPSSSELFCSVKSNASRKTTRRGNAATVPSRVAVVRVVDICVYYLSF